MRGWVDADWAGDTDTCRSHTGYILMMNGGPISWKRRRQDNVFLSTSEAEFVATIQARQKALYLHKTLKDHGYQQNTATEIYEDNLACGAMNKNPVRRKFSRHIDIRHYFVCELVKAGFVKLIPLRTHGMVADAMTKSLPSPAFIGHHCVMMGQTPFALKFLHSKCVYFFLPMIFFPHFIPLYIFLNCPMCSINAHIVHRLFN